MNWEAILLNKWVLSLLTYLTMSYIFSHCTFRLVQSFSNVLGQKTLVIKRTRFIFSSFLFMLSFFVVYVNVHFGHYLAQAIGEILTGIVLGLFWSGCFLVGMTAFNKSYKQVSFSTLWFSMSLTAILLFLLRRVLITMLKISFTHFN